jgi:cell division protein FtsB
LINKANATNSLISKKNYFQLNRKKKYYLLITLVLGIALLQSIRGAYLNIAKYITLKKQMVKLESLNQKVKGKNEELKSQFENYTSSKGIEALARDNLNMVGKDEVLVIIKKPSI